jgi:hypothetical protein
VGDGFDVGLIQGHRPLQLESIEWTRAGVSADDGAELWWHGCRGACLVLGRRAAVAAATAQSPARRARRVCLGRDYSLATAALAALATGYPQPSAVTIW